VIAPDGPEDLRSGPPGRDAGCPSCTPDADASPCAARGRPV